MILQSGGREIHVEGSGPTLDSVYAVLEGEIASLQKAGKRVFIVLSNPNSPANNPRAMLPRRLPWLSPKKLVRETNRQDIVNRGAEARRHLLLIAQRTGATIIDPLQFLCAELTCRTVTRDGRAMYLDDHHLRASYVRDSVTFLDDILKR